MKPNYKPNLDNRPKHLFVDNSYYFITSRTIEGQWFLRPEEYKTILFDVIKSKIELFDSKLIAYVILHNHYHLILDIKKASDLSKFMNQINGASSRLINKADHVIDRKIWWNYYDHIIRNEKDFFMHLNYIHQNPIKHGIGDFNYKFSSYAQWEKKKGKDYLIDCFQEYPIVDLTVATDDF